MLYHVCNTHAFINSRAYVQQFGYEKIKGLKAGNYIKI